MQVTKTQAVSNFLKASTLPELAKLYTPEMEVQVNVSQDGGDPVSGTFEGRQWRAWTDGIQTWKSFRIPFKANTEPEYRDDVIKFDLAAHAEAIGLTGWNWAQKKSYWVAFDFDAIVEHKIGLSHAELIEVQNVVRDIEWVTVRSSTSGRGLHLYVFVDGIPTANHNEHAALARAILGKMAALTGKDLQGKVDVCGHVMWFWHRRMNPASGYKLLKVGSMMPDTEIPINWEDHLPVITKKRPKNLPQNIKEGEIDFFDELCGQHPRIQLDKKHKELISFLKDSSACWWWDNDRHMLVTHTYHLKEAFDSLDIKGIYSTSSAGKEKGADINCFLFPMRNGAWVVRRYTKGVQESSTWEQDRAGWTRCYFNKEPDLSSSARTHGGIEDENGSFVFESLEQAEQAAKALGAPFQYPTFAATRQARIKTHKDGRLFIKVQAHDGDNQRQFAGWICEKGWYKKVFNTIVSAPTEPEAGNYDDIVRHIVNENGEDAGWMIKSEGEWRTERYQHVLAVLDSFGLNHNELKNVVGSSIIRAWKLVSKPFQPEYPGDREWNRNAAQLKYLPSQAETLQAPHWDLILTHCGRGLDSTVKEHGWCRANGIETGADYLRCWVASVFQRPECPLPYLFFWGQQNSGKSIFHEALSKLLTKGYARADIALASQPGFNGELLGAVLCIVEEIDLSKNLVAYNRIKDWVTSINLPIHMKGRTPIIVKNTTHWIQCANPHTACPIFPGDSRITMLYVDELDPLQLIPKMTLMMHLLDEAPNFLAQVLKLDIPDSNDRLGIPVIETEDKRQSASGNMTMLELFLNEKCYYVPGNLIKFGEFFEAFKAWLDPNYVSDWSKIKVGRELPVQYPKGRVARFTNQVCIGNISFEKDLKPEKFKYITKNDELVEVENS